jgi:16S rRNA (guanine966-N2)-methyltransferase
LANGANQVRIIAGRHRGRKLGFTPVRGLRPTPDRVRETLFNWLRDDVRGARCLDLFAGSGALGFEAISRGASALTAVEQNRSAVQRLRDNAQLLHEADKVSIVQADALRFLQTPPHQPFDIVFVDPPFADERLSSVCARLVEPGWLGASCVVYVEQDAARAWFAMPASLQVDREGRVGQSAQRLLRCSIEA